MPVKYVQLGGASRPVKFGFNALGEFGDLTSRSVDQMNKLNPTSMTMRDLVLLFWCALKHGARYEKREFDASADDVGDWFDDNPDAMVEMMQEYASATNPDPNDPALKKKAGKKSH